MLLDQDDWGNIRVLEVFESFVVEIAVDEVVSKSVVARVKEGTEMGADRELLVIRGTHDFDIGEGVAAMLLASRVDIKDEIFLELSDIGKSLEGITPEDLIGNFTSLEGVGVHKMDRICDAGANEQLRDGTKRASELCGDADEVILTNRDNFDGVGELIGLCRSVDILRNKLGRLGRFYGCDGGKEIDELDSAIAGGEEKVKSVLNFTDVDTLSMSIMLEDKLLEVEEGALVRNLLAHLDTGAPGIRSVGFGAVRALSVDNDELDFKGLKEVGVLVSLLESDISF